MTQQKPIAQSPRTTLTSVCSFCSITIYTAGRTPKSMENATEVVGLNPQFFEQGIGVMELFGEEQSVADVDTDAALVVG